MTKQELANKKSSEVRNNTTLFSLFKDFLLEDWGKIPSGCFGCEFNKHYERWAKPYRESKIIVQQIKTISNMNYILKDENFKTFFKGEVLSKNSSSAEWADFILSNKTEERKELFIKLPLEISTEEEKLAEDLLVAEIEEKKSENLTQDVAVNKVKNARKK